MGHITCKQSLSSCAKGKFSGTAQNKPLPALLSFPPCLSPPRDLPPAPDQQPVNLCFQSELSGGSQLICNVIPRAGTGSVEVFAASWPRSFLVSA